MAPTTVNFPTFNTISQTGSTKPVSQVVENSKQKPSKKTAVIAASLACLAAGGVYIATKSANVTKVFNELRSANSMMDVLKSAKLSKSKFSELMFRITKDEPMSEKFISEVTSDPRKSKEYTRVLTKKFGSDEAVIDWMLQPEGYQHAYYKYSHKVYENATKPDDLIKISPNWNIWVIKNKFGNDFSFGELPEGIGNVDKYREIFHAGLSNNQKGYEVEGVKFGEYIVGGMSGKAVREVEMGGKKYIMKFQPPTNNVDITDNLSMKSDSTFLNAQLDRYLTHHNYTQGPKFKFYDYTTNSALYEMTEGVRPQKESVYDIVDVNKRLGDLNSLGVYYNDLNCGNFMVSDGKLNFIDSGESSYVDFFKPGVTALNFSLPNLNGRSITEPVSAVRLAKM